MANVIDRIRVQGNPAPRNLPSQPASGLRGLGMRSGDERNLPPDQQAVQFVLNHSHLQNRDTNSGRRMNQTARRLEHLQRVQQANQGLSTMDVRQPDLQGKQFMLRGKPASAEVAVINRFNATVQQQHQQQEWNGSIASGKSGQRASRHSQVRGDTADKGFPRSRADPRNSAQSSQTLDASSIYPASAAQMSTATSYFLLANPSTVDNMATRSAPGGLAAAKGRGDVARQVSSGSKSGVVGGRRVANQLHSAGFAATFELTGRQVMTPRSAGCEDGFSSRDYYMRSPRHARPAFKDRKSPGLKDASLEQTGTVDPQSLRQCLLVQQTSNAPPNPDLNADAVLRLKHYTHYVRGTEPQSTKPEAKVNYNNPYRQTRNKERRALPESTRRYIFDSVASYIHFNKIYPQFKDSNSPTRKSPQKAGIGGKEGLPKVPHLAGFPNHCTDTILLRMMFEMNRPGVIHGIGLGHPAAGAPSVRSSTSNKYSDIGRQRDLDEFMVQGETPSTAASHRQHHHLYYQNPQPSQRSAGNLSGMRPITSPTKEEDEEGKRTPGRGGGGGDGQGGKIAEAEEDESTLRTATTPGRRLPGDEDDEDADDEASQWTVNRQMPPRADDLGSETDTTIDSTRHQ